MIGRLLGLDLGVNSPEQVHVPVNSTWPYSPVTFEVGVQNFDRTEGHVEERTFLQYGDSTD